MPKLGQSWYPRHVFWHQNKEAIDTEAARLCTEATETGDTRPNGEERSHFDFWQRVITAMMEKLTKKQLEELQSTAKELNKKGVDPEMKMKSVIYFSMGVWVFIFGCYAKPDGTLDVSTHDFNRELGNGKDYIDMQGQRFQEHGMTVSSWQAHNEEDYVSEDLTLADGGHQRGWATMTLEKNSYGDPILPDPSKPPMRSSTNVRKWRLNVLCAFINQHYSEPRPIDLPLLILKLCIYLDLTAGQQKGSAPWMAIGAKSLDYMDEKYIPDAWRTVTTEGDDVYKFHDPSKFSMEMVTQGLQFWYQQQERGKAVFRFKSFLEGKGIQEAPPQ